ncbi:Geranylgeranyl diphosphate reductase, chloroplastic [Gracilariopsis chorda]|uniref:Geranylgeranyl diphosphate reductase, chloroplastic n=1 Tax=Gracilariopsis chorda TaxID=448386 RepID=A0A2V3J5V9_9FLOR|nr:Geranylgeranyl diphosphate reductase, chloroplastic [Gracilariopsis chorda]|eukprot:PXF49789.1 Geranylgeranyl diphosphate reductase, chloroplastic [Gracilariopsis chorda]
MAFVTPTPTTLRVSSFSPSPLCSRRSFVGTALSTPTTSFPASVLMNLRVAVVGGGPAGACAAETLAKAGIETVLFERKMDNCKPCGGAIPLCMVDEFDLPPEIIDRKVRKMKMISPSNVEVDVGKTLKPNEYIGMTRREVLDAFLRDRAVDLGATSVNALVTKLEKPTTPDGKYTLRYTDYADAVGGKSPSKTQQFDLVIGADGANSRVAKDIDAGDYNYAIAFQERIKIPDEKMKYYEDLAEMYVGDDVSPDFYAWVFPKYDHVGVGTGTVINRPAIKKYQKAIRDRAAVRLEGGKIIRIEAHPIPEHPRPRRVEGRVALVGDAAGYVTKCSGEGIYFAAKSGRMCAEAIVEASKNGEVVPTEDDLKKMYLKVWDQKYWATYKVLDILQSLFYRSDPAREAFVEMCGDDYVQRVTFDSYLYKKVTTVSPVDDIKLLFRTASSLLRENLREIADIKKPMGTLR